MPSPHASGRHVTKLRGAGSGEGRMLKASCDQDDCLCLLPPPRLGAEAGLVPDGAEEGCLPHHDKPVVYCHPRHVMRQEDSRWHSTPWLRSSLAPNLKPELDQASRSNLPFTGIPGDRRTGAMTPWGGRNQPKPDRGKPVRRAAGDCGLCRLLLQSPHVCVPSASHLASPCQGLHPLPAHIFTDTHTYTCVYVWVSVCVRERE